MVEYIVKMEKPYDIGKALHYLNVPFVEVRRIENTSSFVKENIKTVMDNAKIPEGLQQKILEIEGLKGTENTLKDKMNNRAFFTITGKIQYIDPVTAHGKLWRNIVLTDGSYLHTTQGFDEPSYVREGDTIVATCFIDILTERDGQEYVTCISAKKL